MRHWPALVCVVALVVGGVAGTASAAPVAVKLQLTELRCIQPRAGEAGKDAVFVVVDGRAAGKPLRSLIPAEKPFPTDAKTVPIHKKAPQVLYEGQLDEGQFAFLTVILFTGGEPAEAAKAVYKAKEGLDSKLEALAGAKLEKAQVEGLRVAANKAHMEWVKGLAGSLGKSAEGYAGLFDVLLVNVGGKIEKRLTPVGLTSGQHYGTDAKVYSKLKYTRDNVLVQDPADGSFYEVQLGPTTEEKDMVYIKSLETRFAKAAAGEPKRQVMDYVTGVQLLDGAGKPALWELGGENPGPSIVHDYWDWAY